MTVKLIQYEEDVFMKLKKILLAGKVIFEAAVEFYDIFKGVR